MSVPAHRWGLVAASFLAFASSVAGAAQAARNPVAILTPDDVIVVSEESRLSSDPYDIIQSNLDFVNALFAEHVDAGEVSTEALKSYYVDYYLAEVNNG